jgi:hypothetical protein
MRVHLIIELEPELEADRKNRQTFAQVTEEFENELEHTPLEVDGQVYNVKVMGVGKNAREVEESHKMRSQYR